MGGLPVTIVSGGLPVSQTPRGVAVTFVTAAGVPGVVVTNGATVPVLNSAGSDSHNGTAVVANGVLTGVNLASTTVMVDQGDTIPQISDGTAVANGRVIGVAAVSAASLTDIAIVGTAKIVKSTVFYTGPAVTGVYATGYTFTIANGVITAIVAS